MKRRSAPDRHFLVVAYQRPASGSPGNFMLWTTINGWGYKYPLLGADRDALYFGRLRETKLWVSELPSSPAFDSDYRQESFPGSRIVAIRKDGLRRWFTTKAACEQAHREASALATLDEWALFRRVNIESPEHTDRFVAWKR